MKGCSAHPPPLAESGGSEKFAVSARPASAAVTVTSAVAGVSGARGSAGSRARGVYDTSSTA